MRGLWLRAPYLHNGSVPTLRALLDAAVGTADARSIAAPTWSIPQNGGFVSTPAADGERYGWLYDTTLPGNGNGGHLWGTDLPAPDKEDLLAYLKTL